MKKSLDGLDYGTPHQGQDIASGLLSTYRGTYKTPNNNKLNNTIKYSYHP